MPKFEKGQQVVVRHQKDQGIFLVQDPCEPTDICRVNGEPVGHYVRIGNQEHSMLGYHEESLMYAEELKKDPRFSHYL